MIGDEGFPLASKIDHAAGIWGDQRYFDLNEAAVLAKDKKTEMFVHFSSVACATIR
jgi:hypothetical protein